MRLFDWPKICEIALTSGNGSGKSTIVRELMYHHLKEGRSVGAIMLEETPIETIDDLISLHISKPVRAIRAGEMMNDLRTKMGQAPIPVSIKETVNESEYNNAKQWLADRIYVYNHEGHNAMANLIARMEFMATSLGVGLSFWIILLLLQQRVKKIQTTSVS